MTTFLVITGFIICLLAMYIAKNKINIDFKSFFKKGFKKLDNKFGLFLYTGKQGKGKTYSAIDFCIKQKLANDYVIITNVKSFNAFEDTIYLDNIFDIIDYCVELEKQGVKFLIFFDEIFTCLEKMGALNKKVLSFLSQLRKREILFVSTAQEWAEIQITFRRYCRFQISCNMIALPFSKTAIVINQVNDGDLIHWDNDLQDFIAPIIQTNISKGKLSIIQSYDTFETINISESINKKR